jgi:hypothetical protein
MGLIIISINIVCEAICWLIAGKKNRRAGIWGVGGLIFGPFAVLLLLYLPKKEKR